MAFDTLEANSTRLDRDYAAIVNWRAAEQAVKDGKTTMMGGVPVIDPAKVPGVLYFTARCRSRRTASTPIRPAAGSWRRASCSRSPASSTSRRSGRRSTAGSSQGEVRGVPVLKYDSHPRRRGAGRPRPAAHAVRRQGQRLHLALRRVVGREVAPSALVGRKTARTSTASSSTRSRCTTTSATWSSAAATRRSPTGSTSWR